MKDFFFINMRNISSYLGLTNYLNPKKEKILIFDKVGSEEIITSILQGLPYVILPTRGEFTYDSPKIRFYRLINKIKRFILQEGEINLITCNRYYLYCLEYIKPKIVITFIDNSYCFHEISQIYRNAEFITIQNGIRERVNLEDNMPDVNGKKLRYTISNFFCFGQKDIDKYKKFGHTILNGYPVGSLQAGYYRAQTDIKKIQCLYDICLISQYRESIMEGTALPEFKQGLFILFDFLKRFILENDVRYCIAMCPDNPDKQRIFYQKKFGGQVELIEQKHSSYFSSYKAVDSSTVSLTMDSTLGFEALGFGKKVLFCSFSNDPNRDINCPELCHVTHVDYALFSQKLKNLLLMDQKDYLEQTEQDRKYLMNYNPDFPAHVVVRQLIEKILNK